MNDEPEPEAPRRPRRYRRAIRWRFGLFTMLVAAALAFNLSIAYYLANDQPDDGKLYSLLAKNMLEQGVFSADPQAPFAPTLIRLPGYPLFLAVVYSATGAGNDTAVRVVQAVFYVAACVLAALIVWNWVAGTKRRRQKAVGWTFFLAAFCPFTAIFSATILTEPLTIFFLAAMTLSVTYAFKATGNFTSGAWWAAAGSTGGIAVLLRPDSGLFALGLGLTLLLSIFFRLREPGVVSRLLGIFWRGIIFSTVFAIVLVPWTIRNEQVFGIFQPLAPAHAEMPGEFVPHGYLLWLRTWIDDSRYIGPMLWDLEEKPIKIESLPPYAFASDEERIEVAALVDQYNHSDPDQQAAAAEDAKDAEDAKADDDAKSDDDSKSDDKDDGDDAKDKGADDEPDNSTDADSLDLKISPEVDAGFQQIAERRIAAEPWRFYVGLPAKRSASMWFDTHSEYYPFGGELFPVKNLDNERNQQFWLPLFDALTWFYTLIAFGGAILLVVNRDRRSRVWLLMAILLSLPRIVFFGTLENPEPRYLVELFLFAAILGGIALARVRFRCSKKAASVELSY